MRRLLVIRFALREVILPTLAFVGGVAFLFIALATHSLTAWMLPLIAGMIGTPLVAIGGAEDPPPDPPPEDARP